MNSVLSGYLYVLRSVGRGRRKVAVVDICRYASASDARQINSRNRSVDWVASSRSRDKRPETG